MKISMQKVGSDRYVSVTPQDISPPTHTSLSLSLSLQVPEGKVVVLSFRYLDLESDNLCRYDFVDIYNGHANGQRIGRFCGTVKPGALVSNSNKMLVQMTSDANTAGSGFIAKFSAAEPHERGNCQLCMC